MQCREHEIKTEENVEHYQHGAGAETLAAIWELLNIIHITEWRIVKFHVGADGYDPKDVEMYGNNEEPVERVLEFLLEGDLAAHCVNILLLVIICALVHLVNEPL